MPVNAQHIASLVLGHMQGQGLRGASAAAISRAVGQAVQGYVALMTVQTAAVGTLGAGKGTGKWILVPAAGTATLSASLAGAGFLGAAAPRIASAVAQGVAASLTSMAVVQTAVAAVAVGAETGVAIGPGPQALASLCLAALGAQGLVGPRSAALATALGQGLAAWFATGVIQGVVAGTPTVPPVTGAGVGIGSIA